MRPPIGHQTVLFSFLDAFALDCFLVALNYIFVSVFQCFSQFCWIGVLFGCLLVLSLGSGRRKPQLGHTGMPASETVSGLSALRW